MVRVAVVGCAHGMLDDIYATVQFINEMSPDNPIKLLLCCGDFECMRNAQDLETLACPPKYRAMHSFYQYYKGEKTVPVLTIFIGGNHEASNYLQELHYGGWVAPNIFYLGSVGCINVGGLRIGGISGIYKQHDYTSGRFERVPFDNSTMRSVYHVREVEVFQLTHLQQRDKSKLDVFLSHDWPRGIEKYGDVQTLIRKKPFFQQEIQANTLGSPPGELLLHTLRPSYWFAAHLHVKFAAVVRHPSEGTIDDMEDLTTSQNMTKFLALDKCLPRREFLQVLDICDPNNRDSDDSKPLKIMFDIEWLAILRATHHLVCTNKYAPRVPEDDMKIEEQDLQWVHDRLRTFYQEKGLDHKVMGEWATDFVQTAPPYGEEGLGSIPTVGNPQTDLILELLKLPHIVTTPYSGSIATTSIDDPNAIDLDDEIDVDPNEIELDE